MTAQEPRIELDTNVIDRLASLICGDDTLKYRAGYELVKFFTASGWQRVNDVDGPRKAWVVQMLTQRNLDNGALRRVILRLADPREYLDDDAAREQVVEELNNLLAIEGYHIEYENGRPRLKTQTPVVGRPNGGRLMSDTPLSLTASLTEIVSDPAFGEQLKSRLTEAHACWQAGAHTAAIIMLGSLLEGVLYDVALAQHNSGRKPDDRLESLINLAKQRGWIVQDVVDYIHVLRNHRNLVHPRKQRTQGYAPESDVVRIAWNVVVAALNDLAAVQTQPAP